MRLSDWRAADVASRLSGGGRKRAKKSTGDWMVCCPAHDDRTPSLHLSDGADGRLLWHCFGGCSPEEVRKAVIAALGGEEAPPKKARVENQAEGERTKIEDPWKPVVPAPARAAVTIDSFQHGLYGAPAKIWTYRLSDGQIAGWVARYDLGDGEKEIIPFVWAVNEDKGIEDLRMKSMPAPRPLYNLDRIAANPHAVIAWNEGEKAADAAGKLFPDWIPTTLPGGSNAIRLVDLEPLAGRTVVAIADHDGTGYELVGHLAELLPPSTDLRLLIWPSHWPADENGERRPYVLQQHDDAADHLERGWTTEKIREAVAQSGEPLTHRVASLPEKQPHF